MDRYDVESFAPYDMEKAPDGMWVMYDDAQVAIAAAVAAERERRTALAADFQEYLYRIAAQVPFDHAEWAQQRGAALLAALRA